MRSELDEDQLEVAYSATGFSASSCSPCCLSSPRPLPIILHSLLLSPPSSIPRFTTRSAGFLTPTALSSTSSRSRRRLILPLPSETGGSGKEEETQRRGEEERAEGEKGQVGEARRWRERERGKE
eukprot:447880-Hanusia_phi.AAC.6